MFPSISEQFKIASILKALDDKIALNNKINNNLLEQSQNQYAPLGFLNINLLYGVMHFRLGRQHHCLT